jgi:hypothetical protein
MRRLEPKHHPSYEMDLSAIYDAIFCYSEVAKKKTQCLKKDITAI